MCAGLSALRVHRLLFMCLKKEHGLVPMKAASKSLRVSRFIIDSVGLVDVNSADEHKRKTSFKVLSESGKRELQFSCLIPAVRKDAEVKATVLLED